MYINTGSFMNFPYIYRQCLGSKIVLLYGVFCKYREEVTSLVFEKAEFLLGKMGNL